MGEDVAPTMISGIYKQNGTTQDKLNVITIETEVAKRKYEVDKERLIECLKAHKNLSCEEIAKRLNKPKTLVEHWFRRDKSFAIPDADVWYQLKDLLGIETSEFDESITTFETLPGKYDMANRIHMGDVSPTYTASSEKMMFVLENHPQDSRLKIKEDGIFQTMGARGGMEYEPHTLMVLEPILLESNQNHATVQTDGISTTLPASMGMGGGYVPMVTEKIMDAIVRRLTPLECERLQGYPDGWTDIGEWVDSKGKKHKDSDSPRYKALGNSIALPFWEWMAKRMVDQLKASGVQNPTMASLFDGISGFCLVFARSGCKPVWSSEIEEFPIAVAKKHFGDDDAGTEGDYKKYV